VLARQAIQYGCLGIFFLFFLMARRDADWPPALVNAPFRLDPLAVIGHLLSSRTFLAGSGLALVTLGLTLVFGRAWCGWLCPLGTTLDLFPFKKMRGKRPAPSEAWRGIKYLLLYATLTASLFGSLTLLALDPLSLLYRGLTSSLWPALDRVVMTLERFLFGIPFLSSSIARLDALLRPAIFQSQPANFQASFLFGSMLCGVLFLNILAERFWCRYLCPLGGLLGLIAKISLFRRRQPQDCGGCNLCSQVCPTGTIDPKKQSASDPGECTLCLECLQACPRGRTVFSASTPRIERNPYDPDRRQALLTFGATGAAILLMRTGLLARQAPPHLIRPPGARNSNPDPLSMTKCIRCSNCMRTCPTNAIQPGALESGLEGFGAPLLIPRLGYCDFSCNACGQVCPVQAIPPLGLAEKQNTVIGRAYIDTNRCIAWADHVNCIVCEEMCPLPDKAIQLEDKLVWGPGSLAVTVRFPHVLREVCIGCGICEYKCPVEGEAAIRIFSPESQPLFTGQA